MRGHRYVGMTFRRDFTRHFGGPGPQGPPLPPPPPTITDSEIQAQAAQVRNQQRARQGRASTLLTAQRPGPDLSTPPTSSPTLLGGGR